jgi:hypothetical protein
MRHVTDWSATQPARRATILGFVFSGTVEAALTDALAAISARSPQKLQAAAE